MKKRLLLLLILIILLVKISEASIPVETKDIKDFRKDTSAGKVGIISPSPIHETASSISTPSAYSVKTSTDTISGGKGISIDKTTGHSSFDYADFYSLNQLDAEQLKDANLKNRVLSLSHAGSIHIKDPFPIDLDEIGTSTFWFEGNDLRAMENTFPKKKQYLINNPLTNDKSSGWDVEHMLDSDKDGITDEVEKLRNLNPFALF